MTEIRKQKTEGFEVGKRNAEVGMYKKEHRLAVKELPGGHRTDNEGRSGRHLKPSMNYNWMKQRTAE